MNEIKSSLSFVEISPEAREAAERAAAASGMDLDAWLAQLIKYTSAMELKAGPGKVGSAGVGPAKAEPAKGGKAEAPSIDVPPANAPPAASAPAATPQAAPAAASSIAATPAAVVPPLPPISIPPAPPAASKATAPKAPGPNATPRPAETALGRAEPPSPPAASAKPAPAPAVDAKPPAKAEDTSPAPAVPEQPPATAEEPPKPAAKPKAQPPRPAPDADAVPTRPVPRPESARKAAKKPALEAQQEAPREPGAPESPSDGTRMIPTDMLQPSRFSALASPKEDDIQAALDRWRASGMLEPLIVRTRPGAQGQFEIISGIDRWHAARRAYVRQIPVIVRDTTDQEALELGLVDQLRRGPVSPLQEASIYQRLLSDAGLDAERVGRLVGKPAQHVATLVRILDLPKSVRGMLEKGEITVLHARALLDAPNPEAIARDIVEKRLDIYQTEQLVRVQGRVEAAGEAGPNQPAAPAPAAAEPEAPAASREARAPSAPRLQPVEMPPEAPRTEEPRASSAAASSPAPAQRRAGEQRPARETDVISTELLERNVSNALGVRCAISERNGVGVVTLHYTSREELGRILARLNGGGTGG